jgi:hypothetical protein
MERALSSSWEYLYPIEIEIHTYICIMQREGKSKSPRQQSSTTIFTSTDFAFLLLSSTFICTYMCGKQWNQVLGKYCQNIGRSRTKMGRSDNTAVVCDLRSTAFSDKHYLNRTELSCNRKSQLALVQSIDPLNDIKHLIKIWLGLFENCVNHMRIMWFRIRTL